jgi:hypothetical protein
MGRTAARWKKFTSSFERQKRNRKSFSAPRAQMIPGFFISLRSTEKALSASSLHRYALEEDHFQL